MSGGLRLGTIRALLPPAVSAEDLLIGSAGGREPPEDVEEPLDVDEYDLEMGVLVHVTHTNLTHLYTAVTTVHI